MTGSPLVLGIDLGTTETRAALFDLDGRQVVIARRGYGLHRGSDGSAEQDPADWWAAIVAAVGELGPLRADVRAVAAVGQGPTLVAVDAAGEPVRAAISWMDQRPLVAAAGDDGSAYSLAPRIAWLAAKDPAALLAARWLLNTWDWVTLRLSGMAAESLQPGEAPLVAAAAAERLPPGIAVGTPVGRLTADSAAALGLPAGIAVVAGVNDGAASILGAGLREPGDAVDTGGASGGLAVMAAGPLDHPGLYSAPSLLPGRWILGGAMAATGAALTWLQRDVLGAASTTEQLIAEAAGVPAGAGGLVFLPYLAGERSPIWDPQARGVFCGLTLAHGRPHLTRAVLEGAALALRHVAAPITAAGHPIRELRLAGRQASSRTWGQIKSDVLGIPAAIPAVPDVAVLGAAMLAAVGAGLVPDLVTAAGQMSVIVERLAPDPEHRVTYDTLFEVYRSLYPALQPAFQRLAAI